MDELRREVSTLREFLLHQSKEIVKLKRIGKGVVDVEDEIEEEDRLAGIELELADQKKSTARITKLCLAAIKALERLEDKPLVLGTDLNSENSSLHSEESMQAPGLDPMIVKSLCGEIEKMTGMLVKVDEDIDALDERTEDNRADVDQIVIKLNDLDEFKAKLSPDNIRREIDARMLIKDVATKSDVARGLKTIPFGLSRDDVNQMIEFATSNFLRTVQAETKMCQEKILDSDEMINSNISQIQARMDEMESSSKAQLASIQQKTEVNLKEMTKSLGKLSASNDLLERIKKLEAKIPALPDTGDLKTRLQHLEDKIPDLVEAEDLQGSLRGLEAKIPTFAESNDLQERIKKLETSSAESKDLKEKIKRVESRITTLNQTAEIKEKIKRLEDNQTNVTNQLNILQEEGKGVAEDPRLTGRIERLGREISIIKSKQTEHTSSLEDVNKKIDFSESETGRMKRVLDQHQDQIEKIAMVEQSIDHIAGKVDDNNKLYQSFTDDLNSKMDKTEVDDLRTGMEKERCKIHYFQDKISNIAKSVDAVKIENNNMRDRFCADIETQEKELKEVRAQVNKQEKEVMGNSAALKDITKESIVKIKDVSANCQQIEKNIRSIRDKSVLYENSLQEVRDLISQNRYTEEQARLEMQQQIGDIISTKAKHSTTSDADVGKLREALKLLENEIKNLKQDRNTKDSEDEERRLSVEGNLLDLRTYVENILLETNTQLGHIAEDVEASQDKISKCMSELEEMTGREEASSGNNSLLLDSLETRVKGLQDYTEIKQVEAVERLLELRKEFVEKHSDYLEMSSSNKKDLQAVSGQVQALKTEEVGRLVEELAVLRTESDRRLKEVERTMDDASRKNSGRFVQIEGKLIGLSTDHDLVESASKAVQDSLTSDLEEVRGEVRGCVAGQEAAVEDIKKLTGRLNSEDATASVKEVRERQAKLRTDLEVVVKQTESLRKELDSRLENSRRNIVEMIGATEVKVAEVEDRIKATDLNIDNLKVTENNHNINLENKLDNMAFKIDSYAADADNSKTIVSDQTKATIADIKKTLDNLKLEVSAYDLESFKNVVNNTNETQNKLIGSIQKNVDAVHRDNNKVLHTVHEVENKLTDLTGRLERSEVNLTSEVGQERENLQKVEERVNNIQVNIREIHEKMNKKVEDVSVSKVTEDFNKMKTEFGNKIETNSNKLSEFGKTLGAEISDLKTAMTSSGQSLQQKFNNELTEVSKSIQERHTYELLRRTLQASTSSLTPVV